MATKLPVEVELFVRGMKGNLDSATGGGGKKKNEGVLATLNKSLKALMKIAIVASVIGFVVDSLKMTKNLLGKLVKILELILRPIDYVLGQLIVSLIRVLLPVVRAINIMFRPFMQKIKEAGAAAGGDAVAQFAAVDQAATQAIQEFFVVAFIGVITEVGKVINNIMWAVMESVVLSIGSFTLLSLRMAGLNDQADYFANALALVISNMEFSRMGINLTIDLLGKTLTDKLSGFNDTIDTTPQAALDADQAIQNMILSFGSIDDALAIDLNQAIIIANTRIKLLSESIYSGDGSLSDSAKMFANGSLQQLINSIGYSASSVAFMGREVSFLTGIMDVGAPIIDTFRDKIKDLIDTMGSSSGGSKKKSFWSLVDVPGQILRDISSFVFGSHQKGTPYIPRTGLYQLHRGEAVIPAGGSSGANVTINVNGYVGNSAELARVVGKELRRELSLMSGHSRGA